MKSVLGLAHGTGTAAGGRGRGKAVRRATAGAALAGALTLAAPQAALAESHAKAGSKTVTVAYVPLPLFEPIFIAMHNGYFAQRGINVKLTVVASGQSATVLAATNKVQVVLGGFSAGLFNAVHQGLDFKVVGSMAEEAPGTAANGLVVAKKLKASRKLTNPGDLKGMKIAVDGGAGSTGAYLTALALAPYHVTLSQVTLVNLNFPEMQSALSTGAVAAAYMSTPFLGAALSSGAGVLLAGAPVHVAVTGVIYGGPFARSPEAQPFFDALAEAAKHLQGKAANSHANLEIVAKATGEKLSLLEAEPPNVFSPDLAPPVATLSHMQSVFLANHNLTYSSPIPSSRYVDTTFATKAG
ncbi:MAG: ABC transporter substrate-binding protein [Actinomycetota bacterium]|nr:ABC transporter substrate-binding protein [Actinomycetota bacterium]